MKILILFLIANIGSKISFGYSFTTDFSNFSNETDFSNNSNYSNETGFSSYSQDYEQTLEFNYSNFESISSQYTAESNAQTGSNSEKTTKLTPIDNNFDLNVERLEKKLNDHKAGLIVIGVFTGLCIIGMIGLIGLLILLLRKQRVPRRRNF